MMEKWTKLIKFIAIYKNTSAQKRGKEEILNFISNVKNPC